MTETTIGSLFKNQKAPLYTLLAGPKVMASTMAMSHQGAFHHKAIMYCTKTADVTMQVQRCPVAQESKANTTPPATTEAICPEVLEAMACINRKFEGSSSCPIFCTNRADMGKAEMPHPPRRGLIL